MGFFHPPGSYLCYLRTGYCLQWKGWNLFHFQQEGPFMERKTHTIVSFSCLNFGTKCMELLYLQQNVYRGLGGGGHLWQCEGAFVEAQEKRFAMCERSNKLILGLFPASYSLLSAGCLLASQCRSTGALEIRNIWFFHLFCAVER